MNWTEAEYAAYLAKLTTKAVPPRVKKTPDGYLPDRYRSKTERLFATTVLDVWQHAGLITQWWYEPMKGLYLAPKTSYTPDFLVQTRAHHTHWQDTLGVLTAFLSTPLVFEVKGPHIYEKDWIKAKQAAALYSCFTFVLAQWKDATWHYKRIPAC
jgi:hypothetical protein